MTVRADGRPLLCVGRDFCPAPSWIFGPGQPHASMFLLLNLAVGGNVGDPPPDTCFPST